MSRTVRDLSGSGPELHYLIKHEQNYASKFSVKDLEKLSISTPECSNHEAQQRKPPFELIKLINNKKGNQQGRVAIAT